MKTLLASIVACKLILVIFMRRQTKHLILGYFVDLVLNWTISLLLSLLTTDQSYLGRTQLTWVSLFTSFTVLQAFFAIRVRLTTVVAAILLTVMLFVNLVTIAVFTYSFNSGKVDVRMLTFDLILLTVINTYLILCSHFLAEFKAPKNSVSGALNVYFAIQSDWTYRLWIGLVRNVSLKQGIKCSKSLPTEQKMCDSEQDGHKTTADSVDLGDDEFNDGLSVSAIY